jgi:hypothetical protein
LIHGPKAVTETTYSRPDLARRGLRRLYLLLTAQSAVAVLISINRLAPVTLVPLPPYEFLRLVEANDLVLALADLAVSFGLVRHLDDGPHGPGRADLADPAGLLVTVLLKVTAG